MRKINLTRGKETVVSDEDYDYLMMWKWYAVKDSSGNYRAYTSLRLLTHKNEKQKYVGCPMSRIIMAVELADDPSMVVDHWNRDTLDNRRCNLNVCTHTENMQNRKDNV